MTVITGCRYWEDICSVVAIEVIPRRRIKIAATIKVYAGSERALQSTSRVSILSSTHSYASRGRL